MKPNNNSNKSSRKKTFFNENKKVFIRNLSNLNEQLFIFLFKYFNTKNKNLPIKTTSLCVTYLKTYNENQKVALDYSNPNESFF